MHGTENYLHSRFLDRSEEALILFIVCTFRDFRSTVSVWGKTHVIHLLRSEKVNRISKRLIFRLTVFIENIPNYREFDGVFFFNIEKFLSIVVFSIQSDRISGSMKRGGLPKKRHNRHEKAGNTPKHVRHIIGRVENREKG